MMCQIAEEFWVSVGQAVEVKVKVTWTFGESQPIPTGATWETWCFFHVLGAFLVVWGVYVLGAGLKCH